MKRLALICGAAAMVFATSSILRADADAAKGYVAEANALIESKDLEGAASKLELATAELDGVDDAAKSPIEKTIEAAQQKITAATAAVNKPKYERMLNNVMDEAEGSIGNLVTWQGAENRFNELMANDEAKAVLGPELEAAAKKFATFKKLNAKKAGAAYAEQAKATLDRLDEEWAESKAEFQKGEMGEESRDRAVSQTEESIADARKAVAKMLPDDPQAKAYNEHLDKLAAEFTQIALAGKVKEVAEQLERQVELYRNEWDEYEKETEGPTWDQYRKESGEKMSAFFAPKTIAFYERTTSFLNGLVEDEDYQAVQSDASIKKIVDDATTKRDAAYAKLVKLIAPVVDAAEKSTDADESILGRLKDDVRVALGEKDEKSVEMQARLEKKATMLTAAASGAEDAKATLITDLHAKAEEVWPGLHEGIEATTEIDLSNPDDLIGKNIAFESDNLMGWRFKPGDFYFATTIGGIPVAGKVNPQLMKQIKATEAAIGRSLGDSDDDGKWSVIAVVTKQKTKLMAKRDIDSTATVDGTDVKITGEYAEPVDAVVVEIIAAKCGPFAGAKDKGVLKEDGSVGK